MMDERIQVGLLLGRRRRVPPYDLIIIYSVDATFNNVIDQVQKYGTVRYGTRTLTGTVTEGK